MSLKNQTKLLNKLVSKQKKLKSNNKSNTVQFQNGNNRARAMTYDGQDQIIRKDTKHRIQKGRALESSFPEEQGI